MKSKLFIISFMVMCVFAYGQAPSITPYTYTPIPSNKNLSWNTSQYESWVYTRYNQWGTAQKLPFRMLKPVGYSNTTKSYPLVIMLHGRGEAGTDNNYHLIWGGKEHLDAVNNAANPSYTGTKKFEGFVVFPQEPEGSWTYSSNFDPLNPNANVTTALSQVFELVDSLKIKYRVDPDRIIVHGLSSGGTGTWYCLYLRPDLFAAALPMSAPATLSQMGRLAPIPIWLSQGGKDDNPIPYISQQEMKALRDSGAVDPTITKYSEYPDLGHFCWNETYDDPDFFPYMLRQNKGKIAVLGYNPVCVGTTIVLSLSPGFYQYEWYYNNNLIVGETGNKLRNVSQPGSYYARFKRSNAAGQVFVTTNTVTITTAAEVPKPLITADNSLIPLNPAWFSINLTGSSGGSQYEWNTGATTSTINVTSAGTYKVRQKKGGNCWSAYSDPAVVVTNQGTPVPAKATNLTATALSPTSVQFTWQDNSNSEIGYEIYRATGNNWDFKYLATKSANSTSYIDNSVSPLTYYTYKVRTYNNVAAAMSDSYAEITMPAASINFYSNSSGNLNDLNTWGSNTDGSGSHPSNFTTTNQVFNISNRTSVSLGSTWTVSGNYTKINVTSGVQLSVNSTLTGNLFLLAGSTVIFNTSTMPTISYADTNSTVEITGSCSISNAYFGNLKLTTGGAKTFQVQAIDVTGNLTLANNVTLTGKPTTLTLAGKLIFTDTLSTLNFISLNLKKDSLQIDGKGKTIQLEELKTSNYSTVQFLSNTSLTLGSDGGGGLSIGKYSTLDIGSGSISIIKGGALNSDSTNNGEIASNQGSIYLSSWTSKNSYIKPSAISKTFKNVTYNNVNGKSITLLDTMLLTNTLKLSYGAFKTSNKLVLVSNLSGTARIAKVESNASLIGEVTWQRWIGPNHVQSISYIGTPIKNKKVKELGKYITVKGFVPSESASLTTWNESSNKWIGVRDSNYILSPGVGFRTTIKTQDIKYASNSAFYQFTGAPVIGDGVGNNNGSFVMPITNTNGRFNLISNPYPSEIDWDASGWNKSDIDNSYYLWDGVNKGYKVYKGAAGGSSAVGTLGMTSIINSGQAFMVKATSTGSNKVVSLNEDVKVASSSLPAFLRTADVEPIVRIRLQDQDSVHIDESVVRFNENASIFYDEEFDAVKYPGSILNISSIVGDEKLAINSIPYSKSDLRVPLHVQAYSAGKYKLNLTGIGSLSNQIQIYLYDQMYDSTINLKLTPTYSFSQKASFDDSQRFELRFEALPADQVLFYSDNKELVQKMKIYPNPSEGNTTFEVDLNSASNLELKVYSPEGVLLYQKESFGQIGTNIINCNIASVNPKSGLYFYVLDTDSGKYSGKIMIK